MIKKLRESNRLKLSMLLLLMSIFCFGISLFRYFVTDTKTFLFLNWNLFLAFIPWLSTSIVVIFKFNQSKGLLGVVLLIWLLFFPNSPYILTDLFHLRLKSDVPKWFDLVLILSFAWTGLIYGFISLFDIWDMIATKYKSMTANISSIVLLFLAGFGIYLGRFLRWNSWDIIQEPVGLISDVADRFINPLHHPRTWGVTVFMGILLNMMFWTIKYLRVENLKK